MPADAEPGMAFVLVQHLAPDHQSMLTELIRRYTHMPVFEVKDGMTVQRNCVYVIPPNRDLAFMNGALQLLDHTAVQGQRLPIDYFFRTLAQDQHERAIGIVLSGTGSDGTLGVRAISGENGMTMAQSLETAEFDGMPRSAIGTSMVDFVLPPHEMPAQLMAYVEHVFGRKHVVPKETQPTQSNLLQKIFVLLRARTTHDFSLYKPNTILRRIERRMAVHQIASMADYVRHLQRQPDEVDALFRDLLIGVTNFFRDPDAFAALESQITHTLLTGKGRGDTIRIWTTGCSTGEEAYSIAILLQECMDAAKVSYKAQIFATDIDAQAIARARTGVYRASVATDITPARLARFFTFDHERDAYRINKAIRDMIVFSEHDLIKDPPFSKLDLISCRNLLIYLGPELQKRIIPLFHYALQPGGVLFLGTSESVGEYGALFSTLDRKAKLYQRQEDPHGARRAALSRLLPSPAAVEEVVARTPVKAASPARLPLREWTEQTLLEQIAPAGALVNRQGDIVYLHGRTGGYLELAPGVSGINNILEMACEGLREPLATALTKATTSGELVRCPGLRVRSRDHVTLVNLTVRPVVGSPGITPDAPLYLVVLEEAPPPAPEATQTAPGLSGTQGPHAENDAYVLALRRELRSKEAFLQKANEELASANEELKSSNEELQSLNEEFQSTNEELETSKEELQSVNEELATVNAELQVKVMDLSQSNNDMNNLLAGTGIGTVFVDFELRILRFTPAAAEIIHLIPSDVGRPVAHFATELTGYENLVANLKSVLDTLVPKEVDVQARQGHWYRMRILPYRTLDNVIEGVVMTFVDITALKQSEEALVQAARELQRLAVVVRDANDAILVQDLEGRILAWNPGAVRLYGWTEAEALRMNINELVPQEARPQALFHIHQLSRAEVIEPFHTRRLTRSGALQDVSVTATSLVDAEGKVYAIATTERAPPPNFPAPKRENLNDHPGPPV